MKNQLTYDQNICDIRWVTIFTGIELLLRFLKCSNGSCVVLRVKICELSAVAFRQACTNSTRRSVLRLYWRMIQSLVTSFVRGDRQTVAMYACRQAASARTQCRDVRARDRIALVIVMSVTPEKYGDGRQLSWPFEQR